MATGLQFRETFVRISGGYAGEGIGSTGLVQDWTETTGPSGSTTTTYWYHDSQQTTDANSTEVRVTITDDWTATKDSDNTYRVTVHSVLNSITRTVVGSPTPLSVSIFVRRYAGGPNIWTSGGCVNAAVAGTHATNVDLGTYTIVLPPGQETQSYSSIYYRSNICGYDGEPTPSIYVDEYGMGIQFRNTLPPDYVPGATYGNNIWWSHDRNGGAAKLYNGSGWSENMRTINGAIGTDDPPFIRHENAWKNMRLIGNK